MLTLIFNAVEKIRIFYLGCRFLVTYIIPAATIHKTADPSHNLINPQCSTIYSPIKGAAMCAEEKVIVYNPIYLPRL